MTSMASYSSYSDAAKGDAAAIEDMIFEDVLDELDAHSVPDELVEACVAQDARNRERAEVGALLDPMVRCLAVQFMKGLINLLDMPAKSWFEAVSLLDHYVALAHGGAEMRQLLPATCVAIVKMQKKGESMMPQVCMSHLWQHGRVLAQMLRDHGFVAQNPTDEEVLAQELAVLTALGWRISPPTIETWMSMVCTRFNVLTRHEIAPSVDWVMEQSMQDRCSLVMLTSCLQSLPPQLAASGLLALWLVKAQVLPSSFLKPLTKSDDEWTAFCLATTRHGGSTPTCMLMHAKAKCIFLLLLASTGLKRAELQDASALIATHLSDVSHSLQIFSEQHQGQLDQSQQQHGSQPVIQI